MNLVDSIYNHYQSIVENTPPHAMYEILKKEALKGAQEGLYEDAVIRVEAAIIEVMGMIQRDCNIMQCQINEMMSPPSVVSVTSSSDTDGFLKAPIRTIA